MRRPVICDLVDVALLVSFQFNGERVQQSAQTSNKDAARQIEAPHRVRLAKGEAGTLERPPASTLKEFSPRFESAIVTLCAEKPATVRFYQEKLRRLLADRQLCCTRLNAIDEDVIDGYKQRRTPASVNLELATLRRLLRLAQEWKVIDRVPRIRLLRGERNREIRAQPWARTEIPASCTATAPRCCDSEPGIRRATRRSRRPPVDGRVPAAGRASEVRVYRNTGREVEEREAQPQPRKC
jgi:hypothetical protein